MMSSPGQNCRGHIFLPLLFWIIFDCLDCLLDEGCVIKSVDSLSRFWSNLTTRFSVRIPSLNARNITPTLPWDSRSSASVAVLAARHSNLPAPRIIMIQLSTFIFRPEKYKYYGVIFIRRQHYMCDKKPWGGHTCAWIQDRRAIFRLPLFTSYPCLNLRNIQ